MFGSKLEVLALSCDMLDLLAALLIPAPEVPIRPPLYRPSITLPLPPQASVPRSAPGVKEIDLPIMNAALGIALLLLQPRPL